MRIRRQPTKFYTTIGNALFEDTRLAADEVGIMAFLLSKPCDWEIRRPALMRRWKYGRDGIRRITFNLIKFGWLHAQKERLSDGRFSITYEIRDEAGPELTDEEVRRALSLVSSEAADDDSTDSSAPDALEPDSHAIPPDTPQPGVADQGAAGRRWPSKEGLLNTDDSNTDSTKPLWSDLRKAWPIGHMVSPFVCENLFAALSGESKKAAFRGIEPFLSDCRSKGRKVCDLATYLREKRWEGLAAAPQKWWVTKPRTPQGFRWREHRIAIGKWSAFAQTQWDQGKPTTEPSEWPPALPAQGDRMGERPGNPSPETESDVSELANEMGR